MATITTTYDVGSNVHVIADCIDPINKTQTVPVVRAGKIIRIRIEILLSAMTLEYDVQLDGQSGTSEFVETDVFPTLVDAIAEYQQRLS
jgi:hypothetical protein